MITDLDEYIDLGLRRETCNRGASNVVYGNQFIAKSRSDEWLAASVRYRPIAALHHGQLAARSSQSSNR